MLAASRIVPIAPRPPPAPGTLADTLLERCRLVDDLLPALRPPGPDRLREWARLRYPFRPQDVPASLSYLRHRDSQRVVDAATDFGGRWGRSTLEARSLASVPQVAYPSTWHTRAAFVAALESIASAVLGRQVRVRTVAVGTVPDCSGLALRFVSPAQLPDWLDLLRIWLLREDVPHVARAAVACQFLSCCHPFEDGNGRTARLVSNALLMQGGMPADAYVPLHELFVLSLGGMEIRSRLVELHGAWNAWIAWFCDLLELTTAVAPNEY